MMMIAEPRQSEHSNVTVKRPKSLSANKVEETDDIEMNEHQLSSLFPGPWGYSLALKEALDLHDGCKLNANSSMKKTWPMFPH